MANLPASLLMLNSFRRSTASPTKTVLFLLMKTFAENFYKSRTWQNTRAAYIKSVGGLCENCLKHGNYKAAVEVHHKIYITPKNINDPNITLNWGNLIALCRECHQAEHRGRKPRYKVDVFGRVTPL